MGRTQVAIWLIVAVLCVLGIHAVPAPQEEEDFLMPVLLEMGERLGDGAKTDIHRDTLKQLGLAHMSATERFIFSHSHKNKDKHEDASASLASQLTAGVGLSQSTGANVTGNATNTTNTTVGNAASFTPPQAVANPPQQSLTNSSPNTPAPQPSARQMLSKFSDPKERFHGSVRVGRVFQSLKMIVGSCLTVNSTVRGNLDVQELLNTAMAKVETAMCKTLITESLQSPDGILVLEGDLVISHPARRQIPVAAPPVTPQGVTTPPPSQQSVTGGPTPVVPPSFLQVETETQPRVPDIRAVSFLAENIVVSGVHQWKLVRHDDFEPDTGSAHGWSLLETSSCVRQQAGASVDHFLGGHCNIANGRVSKTFRRLPPHKQVRVTARYHMIDKWAGETAFMQLGEHYVWSHHSTAASAHGIDMCGSKLHKETRMSIPVDVVQRHTASFLQVSFGSKGHPNQDPCERSFGVDDVMVYVR